MTRAHHNVHSGFGGKIKPGEISPYTLLCGSKELAIRFSQRWDSFRVAADHYEFLILTGEYKGYPLSICSTGIGPAPLAIAMEELANAGVKTVLHSGFTPYSTGQTLAGEIIVVKGAIRWDGASQDYVRVEYPALAHFEMTMAAMSACEKLGKPYQVKITGNPEIFPMPEGLSGLSHTNKQGDDRRSVLAELDAVCGPAEIALLLVQSSLYGLRAGAIMTQRGEWEEQDAPDEDTNRLIDVGLSAMQIVQQWDVVKKEKKRKYMTPI